MKQSTLKFKDLFKKFYQQPQKSAKTNKDLHLTTNKSSMCMDKYMTR